MAVEGKKRRKRKTNPGVRVVGGRIYDSSNGKTCHQCRQKTRDLTTACKVLKKTKLCPIKYCHKCLMNRYGENADVVKRLPHWMCPKCRGICNCSCCMKRRGLEPTGILVHTAKATGFSCVSELLQVKGPENFAYRKNSKIKLGTLVASSSKTVKKKSLEGKSDLLDGAPHAKAPKKTNRKALKEVNNDIGDENAVEESSARKIKISADGSEMVPETDLSEEISEGMGEEGKSEKSEAIHGLMRDVEHKNEEYRFEAQLPEGISSIAISGIDLPPEDIGDIMQFLEFCSAFGKVLDLTKEQAESVVCELLSGRGKTRQQCSMLIHMIILLLCFIAEDRGEEPPSFSSADDNWFKAIGQCVSESDVLDGFPPEMFEKGVEEYDNLDASKKLKLLNFLCDEVLCTAEMRNWIDTENHESDAMKKEAKKKVSAAKEKEKQLKRKMQAEMAKVVFSVGSGDPLTISEHEAIVSQIRAEVKEAHAETLEAMSTRPKRKQRSDVIRTEPVMLDEDGRVFWRLSSYTEEPTFLLQDVGAWGEVSPHEKWFAFKSEQQPEIETYLSCLRKKQRHERKLAKTASAVCLEPETETEAEAQAEADPQVSC